MKIVVYTAVFGGYSGLINQPKFENVDYICYTDQNIKSSTWKVINTDDLETEFDDPTRGNRYYKILPHRHLQEYDISIYIDANFLITCNIEDFINNVVKDKIFMCFDHMYIPGDERDCLYDEYDHIVRIGNKKGVYKDDPEVMKKQLERYKEEGFPAHYGLICGGVLVRKHHNPNVIALMEDWWNEIKYGSKRDQLSFNYLCWKNEFSYSCLPGNVYNNTWFYNLGSNRKNYTKKLLQYRLKKLLKKV